MSLRPVSTAPLPAAPTQVPAAGSDLIFVADEGDEAEQVGPFFRQFAFHVALPVRGAEDVEGKFVRIDDREERASKPDADAVEDAEPGGDRRAFRRPWSRTRAA